MKETEDLIEEMLKYSNKLSNSELDWVKKIDQTTSTFNNLQFTTKQEEVIQSIYEKFQKR